MEALSDHWGVVPEPIPTLVAILANKAADAADLAQNVIWPTAPNDVQIPLRDVISSAHKSASAGVEIRALLTAYAHLFHEPRPNLSELARAQEASPQGLTRRYKPTTVAAINELLQAEKSWDQDTILRGFPSLTQEDFAGLVSAGSGRSN